MNDPVAWEGVDKTVVEKVAADAGHPARGPLINTDQGDLLLFLFLLAGAIGGFIMGYTFRSLFPPRVGKGDSPRPTSGRCPPERPATNLRLVPGFAQKGTVPFSDPPRKKQE